MIERDLEKIAVITIIERLKSEQCRTGITAIRLLRSFNDAPNGLTENKAGNLMAGRLQFAPVAHVNWLLEKWGALPDGEEWVDLTADMVERLKAEKQRTNVGMQKLLRGARHETPPGLNASTINAWLSGDYRRVPQEQYDYVLARWAALPDASATFTQITEDLLEHFAAEKKRTDIAAYALVRNSGDPPADLSKEKASAIVGGANKSVLTAHIDWLIEKWAALPDAPKRIPLTATMIATLQAEKRRTGVGVSKLINANRHILPRRIRSASIEAWMGGRYKTVKSEEYEIVRELWADLPDASEKEICQQMAGNCPDSSCDSQKYEDSLSENSVKESFIHQLLEDMDKNGITKLAMARQLGMNIYMVDRLLDPENDAVTLSVLVRAAKAVGRDVRLELV